MTTEVTLTVGGSRMPVLIAVPSGSGRHPAIVLLPHREGVDEFIHKSAARLAENGFLTAAPNLYHRRPPGEDPVESRKTLKDGEVVADTNAVVEHLLSRPDVRPDAIAVMGHCAGGRMAYLGAGSNPRFKAAVVLYGGGIARPGPDGGPAPLALTGNIKGPVLGLWGKDDEYIPAADLEKISAELTRHNIRHAFHSFDGAGHAFQNFADPHYYRKDPSEAAWAVLLEFLKKELQA